MFDDFDDQEDGADYDPTVSASPANALLLPRQSVLCLGYEDTEKQLLQAFTENRMPHAIILSGPEGIGKATFAYRLARFLLKSSSPSPSGEGRGEGPDPNALSLFGAPEIPLSPPSPQGEGFNIAPTDSVFSQVASGGHADLLVIERLFDEKKGRLQAGIAVEEIRRVTPFLRMTAGQGGWRVVIFDDADTIPRYAQNALLKILEEPPANTLLILIAHNAGSLLPTIRSRCRLIACQPPSRDLFATLLTKSQPDLSARDLDTLYAITKGSTGQALRLQQEGGLETVTLILGLLATWPSWNWPEIHQLADNLSRPDQADSLRVFEEIFIWILESIVRTKAGQGPLPAPLKNTVADRMLAHYPLTALLDICENIRAHFETVSFANLDKRQSILGAFSLFKSRAAA